MLCDLFFSQRPLCCWRVSAMLDTWLPALSKSLLCWSLQSIHQSVRHIHCGLVRNESLNIRIRRTKKGKEIFRVKVGVRYGKVCLTGREWQIKPTGSLSLHLRVDNAGLPISVHELHQFSGSIVEINVSFPSLCLSNTALSYLCVSVCLSFSDFLPRPGMLDEMSVCCQTGCDWKGWIYIKSSCSEVSLAVLLLHVKLGGLLVGFSCKDCSNKVCKNALQQDQWN